jgi:hypothetical protein
MKKKLIALLIVGALSLTGCAHVKSVANKSDTSMFVTVEETYMWDIVYNRETKVMYVVATNSDACGVFTLLVNADGTPMLYED